MESSVLGDYIVLPEETLCCGRLAIRDEIITSIDRNHTSARLTSEPTYVLPGLVDTHSDAVELAVEPRLGADVPYPVALHALEMSFISAGITTCFHALHTLGVTTHRRSFRAAGEILNSIQSLTTSHLLQMSHLAILRCELPDRVSHASCLELLSESLVRGIALEDHAQGRGVSQHRFHRYFRIQFGFSDDEIAEYQSGMLTADSSMMSMTQQLAKIAIGRNLKLLSLDASTATEVLQHRRLGVSICQFPASLEAAREAKKLHLTTVSGANNALCGTSQSGNIRTHELIEEMLVDGKRTELPSGVWSVMGMNICS